MSNRPERLCVPHDFADAVRGKTVFFGQLRYPRAVRVVPADRAVPLVQLGPHAASRSPSGASVGPGDVNGAALEILPDFVQQFFWKNLFRVDVMNKRTTFPAVRNGTLCVKRRPAGRVRPAAVRGYDEAGRFMFPCPGSERGHLAIRHGNHCSNPPVLPYSVTGYRDPIIPDLSPDCKGKNKEKDFFRFPRGVLPRTASFPRRQHLLFRQEKMRKKR